MSLLNFDEHGRMEIILEAWDNNVLLFCSYIVNDLICSVCSHCRFKIVADICHAEYGWTSSHVPWWYIPWSSSQKKEDWHWCFYSDWPAETCKRRRRNINKVYLFYGSNFKYIVVLWLSLIKHLSKPHKMSN